MRSSKKRHLIGHVLLRENGQTGPSMIVKICSPATKTSARRLSDHPFIQVTTCQGSERSSRSFLSRKAWEEYLEMPDFCSSNYGHSPMIRGGFAGPRECSRAFFSLTITTLRSSLMGGSRSS